MRNWKKKQSRHAITQLSIYLIDTFVFGCAASVWKRIKNSLKRNDNRWSLVLCVHRVNSHHLQSRADSRSRYDLHIREARVRGDCRWIGAIKFFSSYIQAADGQLRAGGCAMRVFWCAKSVENAYIVFIRNDEMKNYCKSLRESFTVSSPLEN